MALPVLSSSAVKFRRVLAHFPQELSLAFAYGSGVFRQAGASAEHGEVSARAPRRSAPRSRSGPAAVNGEGRRSRSQGMVRGGCPGRARGGPGSGAGAVGARGPSQPGVLFSRGCLFTSAFTEGYYSLSNCCASYEGNFKSIAALKWQSGELPHLLRATASK